MFTPRDILAIARIANEFRAVEEDLPVSYVAVLAYIARHELERHEPPNATDVSNSTGIGRPGMSRIIRALSDTRLGSTPVGEERPANSRPSLKLVERHNDPVDHRMVRLKLTPKGRALLGRVADILHTHTENTHGNSQKGKRT